VSLLYKSRSVFDQLTTNGNNIWAVNSTPFTLSWPKGGKRTFTNRVGVSLMTLLLPIFGLVALFVLTPTVAVRAQEKEPEVTLPACGIRYPGGFDSNTVGVVEGRAGSFFYPEQGPVSFRLETAGDIYTVLTGPAWFLKRQQLEIRDGDHVLVKGSKSMGTDGNLYLVAQEITVSGSGKPMILRDASGIPAWSGRGRGMRGR